MAQYPDLTEDQKRFFEENDGTLSDKSMAKKLGISRKALKKYRSLSSSDVRTSGNNGNSTADTSDNPAGTGSSSLIKRISVIAGFCAVIFLALYLRQYTFDLPHLRGDQHHYAGLAFKLDTRGMAGYSLRGIGMYGVKGEPNVVVLGEAEGKGHVIDSLERANIFYYDEPLHHIPFGFPAALMLSHKIFSPDEPYTVLTIPNDTEYIRNAPRGQGLRGFRFPPGISKKQFYSVIIPLGSSILLIAITFFLGRTISGGNNAVALTAMYLMAISPIDILSSQKVWADDMTAMTAAAAVLLYILARAKDRPSLAFAGGLLCGISAITKQNGAFVVFAVIAWHFINNADRLVSKDILKVVFDKNLVMFGLGGFVSAGYWFIKVYTTYGDPFYRPHQENIASDAAIGWFKTVGGRPRYLYAAGIPYQNPLFALAYIAPIWIWFDRKNRRGLLIAALWAIAFLFVMQGYLGAGGKEHRYMLPAYPAFAVLGAYAANRIRLALDRSMGYRAGTILLIIILIASFFWSTPMAYRTLFYNGALIMEPF